MSKNQNVTKLESSKCELSKKVTKLKNSNCNKTKKINQMWPKKTQNVTKLNNPKCKKLKKTPNSKTPNVKKKNLKNFKCDKTQKLIMFSTTKKILLTKTLFSPIFFFFVNSPNSFSEKKTFFTKKSFHQKNCLNKQKLFHNFFSYIKLFSPKNYF